MTTKSPCRIVLLALLLLTGLCAAQPFTAADYFGDATLSTYSLDIGFCFRITISDENLDFGNITDLAQKLAQKIDINVLAPYEGPTPDSAPSHFLADDKKWTSLFFERDQNADWTLVIQNSGTLTLTRLGPDDKVIPVGAVLSITGGQPSTTQAITDGLSFAVQAGQTWYISYIHTVRSTGSVTYTFTPGWNLLSLPIVVYDKQPGKTPSWDALLALRPMTLSGNTFVRRNDIGCGEAFWVFNSTGQNIQLTVSGFKPLPSEWPAPTPGWNFRGTKGEEDNNVYNNIYTWNNEAGLYKPDDATPGSELGFWSRQTPIIGIFVNVQ